MSDTIARHYYRHYNGEIPDGLVVRHTCDNTQCINPNHLLLGTHADNVRDKMERGRHKPRGLGKNNKNPRRVKNPMVTLAGKVNKIRRQTYGKELQRI